MKGVGQLDSYAGKKKDEAGLTYIQGTEIKQKLTIDLNVNAGTIKLHKKT